MKTTTNDAKLLSHLVVEGIREKKGKHISVIDLTTMDDAICSYMVIAEGNTPIQVEALLDSVEETVRKGSGDKPLYTHVGTGEWVALDYVNVIVHLFVPTLRQYYNIEQLWADAHIERLPDLD